MRVHRGTDLAALSAWRSRPTAVIGAQAFADGQHPISLGNPRVARELADRQRPAPVSTFRAWSRTRYIQRFEPGMSDRTIAELVKLTAKTAHVIMMDGAQDARANTGGFLATD
ncbi:MAG: hypothetical protein KIS89_05170 [Dokdonella sp.]|nr:hypothetical protein [Dokdonella sp.]